MDKPSLITFPMEINIDVLVQTLPVLSTVFPV